MTWTPAIFAGALTGLPLYTLWSEALPRYIRIISCIQHSLVDAYRVGAEFKQLDIQHIAMIRGYLET